MKLFSLTFILFFTLTSLSCSQNLIDSSTVAYYPFNNNAVDETGNGNDGVVNGAVLTTDRFGKENSAYYFSGKDCKTRIDAQINTSVIQDGLTISIWVMRVGDGCIGPRLLEFYAKNGPGQAQWHWDNNPKAEIILGSITSTGFKCHTKIPKIADSVWTHLVYTNDGKVGKFYKDGKLVNTVQSKGKPILSGKAAFGRMNHRMWDAFNGKLDDISIWSRALTEEEIAQTYHQGGWPLELEATPEAK